MAEWIPAADFDPDDESAMAHPSAILTPGLVTLEPLGPEEASFIAQMRRQVKSENTVGAYLWGLKHLRSYLHDRGITGFSGINREVLEEWQDYLATNISPLKGKPLSPRSQGLCASAARMFFTWAAIRDKCDAKLPLLFTKVKVAPLQPRPLKDDVMLRIRHYFIEKTGTPRYMRDRALFFYTIGVGARVSEVLRVPRVGRNKRSVWTIPTQPYPEAHFATFPEALVEPCIKAGSREGDTVLDPFTGSGTTLAVARRLGRKAIGIELQPDYLPLIQKRVREAAMPLLESISEEAAMGNQTCGPLFVFDGSPLNTVFKETK